MERHPLLDVTSRADEWVHYIPAPPSWKITARNIEWRIPPEEIMTSAMALTARIEEEGSTAMMEGEVIIVSVSGEMARTGRDTFYVEFRGQGALVNTNRVIDRTPLDSVRWQEFPREQIPITDEIKKTEGFKIIIDDRTFTSTETGTTEGTEATDREEPDSTPRGFRVVP